MQKKAIFLLYYEEYLEGSTLECFFYQSAASLMEYCHLPRPYEGGRKFSFDIRNKGNSKSFLPSAELLKRDSDELLNHDLMELLNHDLMELLNHDLMELLNHDLMELLNHDLMELLNHESIELLNHHSIEFLNHD